jgi:hypothetical protein
MTRLTASPGGDAGTAVQTFNALADSFLRLLPELMLGWCNTLPQH